MPAVKKGEPPTPPKFMRAKLPIQSQSQQSPEDPNLINVSLPDERKEAKRNFWDFTWLIYGEKKVGKTSLANEIEDNFIMAFEPGDNALESLSRPVPKWEYFLRYVDLLEMSPEKYSCVTIDTGTILYDQSMEYACKKYNFVHPGGMNDYGASWKKVEQEFKSPLLRLFALPFGKIIIAHSVIRETETLSGMKISQVIPLLSGQADSFFTAIIDNIAFYRYIKNERYLTIRGNEYVTAGTRCKYNFFTTNGDRIYNIPMGNSEKEAYQNLLKAFNNQQEETFEELNFMR